MERQFAPHALFVLAMKALDKPVILGSKGKLGNVLALDTDDLVLAQDPSFHQCLVLFFPDEILDLLSFKVNITVCERALEFVKFSCVVHAPEILLDAFSVEKVIAGEGLPVELPVCVLMTDHTEIMSMLLMIGAFLYRVKGFKTQIDSFKDVLRVFLRNIFRSYDYACDTACRVIWKVHFNSFNVSTSIIRSFKKLIFVWLVLSVHILKSISIKDRFR